MSAGRRTVVVKVGLLAVMKDQMASSPSFLAEQ